MFCLPAPFYIMSKSGIVHLRYDKNTTYCRREIKDNWADDDNLLFRAWRSKQNSHRIICRVCDRYRQEYYRHFAPFINSIHKE